MEYKYKIFPYIENRDSFKKLKIDRESLNYISTRNVADEITKIIKFFLLERNIDPKNMIITDMTAGVGGDTISFARNFKSVNAVEINKTRSEYLQNNINVFNLTNVRIYNDDCIKIISNIDDHNIIYIDPPWGGKHYKFFNNLRLTVSNLSLETICLMLLNKNVMKKIPQFIVLKLPKNYDIYHIYDSLKNYNVYLYDIKKMFIIIISFKE